MTEYLIRRLLLVIPTFIGITLLVFCVTRFVPGGPVEKALLGAQLASESGGGTQGSGQVLSASQIEDLKAYYGLDQPVLISYVQWLKKVARLDLGTSSRYSEPVWETIRTRLPVSIYYGLATLVITYGVCIPLGVVKALNHATPLDNITSIVVFVGYAIPGYVIGIALISLFAYQWEWFPLGGFVSDDFEDLVSFWPRLWDVVYHSVLPLTAYVAGSFAVMTFLVKNSLMDQLSSDYVRTAMAKGVPFRGAVFKHALRNSLIPVATGFGNNISLVLTGSFLIEKIFNIDGIGLLGYESLVERDYPVVLGVLVISSILFLIGNILSDLCVAIVDPRVKFA